MLADRYSFALKSGTRLRVCLEGDEGHAKGDLLWRLSSQGYGVFQLPFVPWLSERVEDWRNDEQQLSHWSRIWQAEWLEAARKCDSGRPGLLFVARSPLTSALELARRKLSNDIVIPSEEFVVVQLNADSIQVQRRVAEKTFNEPDSKASRIRRQLHSAAALPEWFRPHASVNSTSGKQGTAALLKLVGVQAPSFPSATRVNQSGT